jgi:hypothetical protein
MFVRQSFAQGLPVSLSASDRWPDRASSAPPAMTRRTAGRPTWSRARWARHHPAPTRRRGPARGRSTTRFSPRSAAVVGAPARSTGAASPLPTWPMATPTATTSSTWRATTTGCATSRAARRTSRCASPFVANVFDGGERHRVEGRFDDDAFVPMDYNPSSFGLTDGDPNGVRMRAAATPSILPRIKSLRQTRRSTPKAMAMSEGGGYAHVRCSRCSRTPIVSTAAPRC